MIATLSLMCFLITSNLSSAKAIQFSGISLTAGFFTYPFVYMCSSIIMATRSPSIYFESISMAYLGYLAFISLMYVSSSLPATYPDSVYTKSFDLIYDISNYRIYLASLCGYFLSMFLFSIIFNNINIKNIALKITLATFVVAVVDVNVFLILAFWGIKEPNLFYELLFWASIKKILAQALLIIPSVWIINYIRSQNEYCFSN